MKKYLPSEVPRSWLFTYYNRAKRRWDRDRANKSLGLILSGKVWDKFAEYGTTPTFCDCPDSFFNRGVCKHMIAYWILSEIERREFEALQFVIGQVRTVVG